MCYHFTSAKQSSNYQQQSGLKISEIAEDIASIFIKKQNIELHTRIIDNLHHHEKQSVIRQIQHNLYRINPLLTAFHPSCG